MFVPETQRPFSPPLTNQVCRDDQETDVTNLPGTNSSHPFFFLFHAPNLLRPKAINSRPWVDLREKDATVGLVSGGWERLFH